MFKYGLEKHSERGEEIKLFLAAIEEAKQENKNQASLKIDEFMAYKQKVTTGDDCVSQSLDKVICYIKLKTNTFGSSSGLLCAGLVYT
jgi:hypothetical protein